MKNIFSYLNTIFLMIIAVFVCLLYFKIPEPMTRAKMREIREIKDINVKSEVIDNLPFFKVDVQNQVNVDVANTVEVEVTNPVEVEGSINCY